MVDVARRPSAYLSGSLLTRSYALVKQVIMSDNPALGRDIKPPFGGRLVSTPVLPRKQVSLLPTCTQNPMPSLTEAKAANQRDASALSYRPVAVFIGGTSGLGQVRLSI